VLSLPEYGKEDAMLNLPFILADGVTIQLGGNVWNFGINFLIDLIVAAVIGLVAESIVGRRLPFGFVGAIIAALVGAWLLTKVIVISGIGDINVYNVPIFRALVGAIILVALWQLLASGLGRGRNRNSYRRG
jgi:uncharacterized membrane protein YeaQ/YmgE (transglycosylase-associated protein family)